MTLAVGASASVISNDRYADAPVRPEQVVVRLLPGGGLDNAQLSSSGVLTVPARTLAGDYLLRYEICLAASPSDCSSSAVRLHVEVPTVQLLPNGLTPNQAVSGGFGIVQIAIRPTTISVPLPTATHGAYNFPLSQLDAAFSDFYPMSDATAQTINAVNYWQERLDRLSEEHPDWDAAQLAYWRTALTDHIATLSKDLPQQFLDARQNFWDTLTAPPDPAAQRRVDELNREIQDLLVAIRKSESATRAASQVVNLVTLGLGGLIVEEIGKGVEGKMYDDLAKLCAERAALDGSSRRTVVAAGMTNQLINLLERGGPYNPDETELINQIGGMVQQSSVQVAETSSRLFSNWMQEQQELRRLHF